MGGTFNKAHVRAEDDVTTPPTPLSNAVRVRVFPAVHVSTPHTRTSPRMPRSESRAITHTRASTPTTTPLYRRMRHARFHSRLRRTARVLGDVPIRVSRQ